MPIEEKRAIGADIKTVQYGWPIGMRLVDHFDGDIWDVRTRTATQVAQVQFAVEGDASGAAPRIHQERSEDAKGGAGPSKAGAEEAQEYAMKTKAAMARRMGTARAQLDRVLNP